MKHLRLSLARPRSLPGCRLSLALKIYLDYTNTMYILDTPTNQTEYKMILRQTIKTVDYVVNFNVSDFAARRCVCSIEGNIGRDAFGECYSVVTDDYGVISFVAARYVDVK